MKESETSEALTKPFDARDALKQYKQAIWSLLLANGGIRDAKSFDRWHTDDDVNHYGSSVEVSWQLTVDALEEIKKHGIDWTATTDPATHVAYCFNGTFTDSQLEVPYLKGYLALNDGSVQQWLVNSGGDLPTSFAKMLQLIVSADPLETALEKLEDRLTDKEAREWLFSYSCRI